MKNDFADVWFFNQQWTPHPFQKETWSAIAQNRSGVLNAPTGYGKTFAVWFGIIQHYYNQKKENGKKKTLHALWITPLRALSKEILLATQKVSYDLELDYTIELRTGDTTTKDRQKQRKSPPDALITTPESVHLLLATKGYENYFKDLEFIVVDEWHELMGSKRGVMMELALSRLKTICPNLKIWGISATIGNLEEAKNILIRNEKQAVMVRAVIQKNIEMHTIYPDNLEKFPLSGHLGVHLIQKTIPLIYENRTTLLFTNTRSQAEIWYHRLLDADPDLAGQIALHHGSLSEEVRLWVEEMLHQGVLKAVVCTSTLDLGVDFRSVDCVVQIGSPKGIARFLQRAGRSGHRPGETSKIYFLPTHSLEIMEGSSLRYAVKNNLVESRLPYIRSFDMLIQFMMTLAIGEGFYPDNLYNEVKKTHAYESISREEFDECLLLITQGGNSLYAYDEFHKVDIKESKYVVTSRRIAMQHRLSIGAITSDMTLRVKVKNGKYIGNIEERFISRLDPGDAFWFAGRSLEVVSITSNVVTVKESTKKSGKIPSWQGGRFPISSDYGFALRHMFAELHKKNIPKTYEELRFLKPLFDKQAERSHLPNENELLVEYCKTRYGHHLFVYPFEGKLVHDGMASILAYRIGQYQKISFSIASNDYGFELLAKEDFLENIADLHSLFSSKELMTHIRFGVNIKEMAKRIFRDIAQVSGLIFTGYPGKTMRSKHLQANSSLFFNVFEDNEPDHLLYRQAYDEVYDFQLEIERMQRTFARIETQEIIIKKLEKLSPFSFPILSESFRAKYSNEEWQDRLDKLKKDWD